jgi:18S rRNA (adenine1779-N6/adenine1780-N6)-dimethyltransferase
MFQREFADRLVSRPGQSEYSRLSVSVQTLAQVDHVLKVSRNSFKPPPRVDSSVVRIEPRFPKPDINMKDFDSLLRLCFLRKNKTLSSIFKTELTKKIKSKKPKDGLPVDTKEVIKGVLKKMRYGDMRASKMDIEDFLRLLLEFKRENVEFCQ